jgi:hypothetical protein
MKIVQILQHNRSKNSVSIRFHLFHQVDIPLQSVILNSIVSQWYVDLRLDSDILVQEIFYIGYGGSDAPSNADWFNALNDKLQYLYQEGLDYSINNDVITISNSSCMDNFTDKTIYLNIGINITIDCG